MQVDADNRKAVNAWVAQAKQEGWKRPRDVAEQCSIMDPYDEAAFGNCDSCHRTYVDSDTVKWHREWCEFEAPLTFEVLFEGGRWGISLNEGDFCDDCLKLRDHQVEKKK
jgi:hypothetical protein